VIYLVAGWPGAGKSTICVSHAIERYLAAGRRVAANFPIDVSPMCLRRGSKLSQGVVRVVPDRPTRADLDSLGVGGEREELAGMLLVDEAGGWLNARSWQGGEREAIIDWLTQSRKRYWDVYLVAQAPAMLDRQVREAVCEAVVRIRRLDRWRILGLRLPRLHIGLVRYGLEPNAPLIERWIYRGTEVHRCFGSYRLFGEARGHYSMLPATMSKWRYLPTRVWASEASIYNVAGWGCCAVLLPFAPALAFSVAACFGLLARLWASRLILPSTWAGVSRIRYATGAGHPGRGGNPRATGSERGARSQPR